MKFHNAGGNYKYFPKSILCMLSSFLLMIFIFYEYSMKESTLWWSEPSKMVHKIATCRSGSKCYPKLTSLIVKFGIWFLFMNYPYYHILFQLTMSLNLHQISKCPILYLPHLFFQIPHYDWNKHLGPDFSAIAYWLITVNTLVLFNK
jgi:hypothetical protein